MENKLLNVNLENFAGGVIPEMFERELKRVLEDIDDPNTSPKKLREINIKIALRPDENRETCAFGVSVTSKICGVRPQSSILFLVRRGGRLQAFQSDPRQMDAFADAKPQLVQGGTDGN